jgi:hypothetical protein
MGVFNALVTGLIALALVWAVMSPRFDDGIVIKIGLASMALGFLGVSVMSWLDQWWMMPRALVAIHGGLLLILGRLGHHWLKMRRAGKPIRGITDWGDLDPLR